MFSSTASANFICWDKDGDAGMVGSVSSALAGGVNSVVVTSIPVGGRKLEKDWQR